MLTFYDSRLKVIVQVIGMLDYHTCYTAIDSTESTLNLRYHTFIDSAIGTQSSKALAIDRGYHAAVVVHIGEHAILLETEDEVGRFYLRSAHCYSRSYAIGIAIEQ